MAWRLAYSLETLRDQVNAAYPDRSTASDGTFGDAAHQAEDSDHNPNGAGVVTAFDITHDPANGLDSYALADDLLANRHPDLKYLISNYRIAGEFSGWNWAYYDGIDPHTNHLHVSVGRGEDGYSTQPYDDRVQWNVKGGDMSVEETLRSALQKYKMDAETFESAMNVARNADKIHESALNASDAKVKALEKLLASSGTTLAPGKYIVP